MKLEDLKGMQAYKILRKYKGKNPYIKKLKWDHEHTRGGISLTPTQSKYIVDNHEYEPLLVNRVIEVTDYVAEELQKSNGLKFKPNRIKVGYILGETEKAVHIYGMLSQKQKKAGMYFIPIQVTKTTLPAICASVLNLWMFLIRYLKY